MFHLPRRSAECLAPENGRSEECIWFAHLAECAGGLQRLGFALGCCWAALAIDRERGATETRSTTSASRGSHTMTAYAYHGLPLFPRRPATSANGALVCEINTTPLIDVMLVLLVTLIIALPTMTHAVMLDLPPATPPPSGPRPEVISVDIELDGTITWNGVVTSLQQLDGYFHTEATKSIQPEIHLRPESRSEVRRRRPGPRLGTAKSDAEDRIREYE